METKRLITTVLGIAFGVSSFANTLEPNLNGFHIEAKIGGVNYQNSINGNLSNTNAFSGIGFGYSHSINNLILGISADVNFTNVSNNTTFSDSSTNTKINGFGSIKGLVGVKINPESYLYATSGIGYIRSSLDIKGNPYFGGSNTSFSKTIPAYIVGLGFNYTIPIGLYLNVGADYYIGRNFETRSPYGSSVNVSTRLFVTYVGVGYRF